ncbi:MAG: 4Fe-4S binding protein [Nitrospirae bacterium]|nr:4Fe-4S binding protein [Nitrospirota bacterium]
MNIKNLHIYRRTTQVFFILLIFSIPVLDILRYDTATRELIVFGQAWSIGLRPDFFIEHDISGATHVALQFFLKAILPWLFILSTFPLLGYFTGRFFCGWMCPEGAFFELADFLTLKLLGRRSLYGKKTNDPETSHDNKFLYAVITAISAIIIPAAGGIALTGFFIAPKTIWSQIINWDFTFGVKAGIIGVSVYMLISLIFVRHALCKYVCSAGLMQMLFGWASPVSLRIHLDAQRINQCTDCRACERVCFMNVKPRLPKKDINCVTCGECITACNKELGAGKGLFNFSAGDSNTKKPVWIPAFAGMTKQDKDT